MIKSKRLLIIMLAITLISITAIGCASTPEVTEPAQPEPAPQTEPVSEVSDETYLIGISMPNITHPMRMAGQQAAEKWMLEHPDVNIAFTDGQGDSMKQNDDVEDLLTREVDVLIISPNVTDALRPAQDAANRAGVMLVGYDRALPGDDYDLFIAGDNVEMGRVAARWVIEKIGESGFVIELEGLPGSSATIDRQGGFHEVMANYPNITIESYSAEFRRHNAVEIMEDLVQRHGDRIDAIFAHNDEMALGAVQVLEPQGLLDDIWIIGCDGQVDALESIKDGKLDATVAYPTHFPEVLDYTYRLLKGETLDKKIPLETPLIDINNADDYYDENAIWWVNPKN